MCVREQCTQILLPLLVSKKISRYGLIALLFPLNEEKVTFFSSGLRISCQNNTQTRAESEVCVKM